MEPKKWASNCDAVLKCVLEEDQEIEPTFAPTNDTSLKVLGVHCDPIIDSFRYHAKINDVPTTKRTVLSTMVRLYDSISVLDLMMLWTKGVM